MPTTRALAAVLVGLLIASRILDAEGSSQRDHRRPVRIIGQTEIVGDVDGALWNAVLDVLPVRPGRIEVVDLSALSPPVRQKVAGLDAFVLDGRTTIFVIRQGATLRRAAFGDAVDRLALASLVWHELAHVNGSNEAAALEQEQALWRRFIVCGLVDSGDGMAYIARLREVSGQPDAR